MKKYYSKKERQQMKSFRLIIMTSLLAIILISVLLSFYGPKQKDGTRIYTAEELLHDHDGDGIPEH